MNCGLKINPIPRWISVGVDLDWTTGQVKTFAARRFYSFNSFSQKKTLQLPNKSWGALRFETLNFSFQTCLSVGDLAVHLGDCKSNRLSFLFCFIIRGGRPAVVPRFSFSAAHLVSPCLMSAGVWDPGGAATLWTSHQVSSDSTETLQVTNGEPLTVAGLQAFDGLGHVWNQAGTESPNRKPSRHERDYGTVQLYLKGSLVHISAGLSSEQNSFSEKSDLRNQYFFHLCQFCMIDELIHSAFNDDDWGRKEIDSLVNSDYEVANYESIYTFFF